MSQRRSTLNLIGGGTPGVDTSFKFTINTALDTGDDYTIPTRGSLTYLYDVDWGDSNQSLGQTGDASHTYSTGGTYQITITGTFPQMYSFGTADATKVISVDNWGTILNTADQNSSFRDCANLTTISNDNNFLDNVLNINSMFRTSGLTAIPSGITFESTTVARDCFRNCPNLTSMSDDVTFEALKDGGTMFYQTPIANLSANIDLESLVTGTYMFFDTELVSIPEGVALDNLSIGLGMFQITTTLTTLPSTLTLTSLTNGNNMFASTGITSIPNLVVLPNLTKAQTMFQACGSITSCNNIMIPSSCTNTRRMFRSCGNLTTGLKSGNTLSSVGDARQMFENCSLTEVPSTITLASLNQGLNMFLGNSLSTASYSQLINNIDANNSNTGVIFNGGSSNYDSSAQTAHDNLTGTKTWTITDSGLI